MIYLMNRTGQQSVYIPRQGLDGYASTLTFTLTSTVNGDGYSEEVQDQSVSDQYFLVNISLPAGTQSGEHEYQLSTGAGDIIAWGVCMVWPEEAGPAGQEFQQTDPDPEPEWTQYDDTTN